MNIHQRLATTAARIAGSVPVMKNYDMEGNLHLVAVMENQNAPRVYSMDGRLEPLTTERIIERGFMASINAAGIACCAC